MVIPAVKCRALKEMPLIMRTFGKLGIFAIFICENLSWNIIRVYSITQLFMSQNMILVTSS